MCVSEEQYDCSHVNFNFKVKKQPFPLIIKILLPQIRYS